MKSISEVLDQLCMSYKYDTSYVVKNIYVALYAVKYKEFTHLHWLIIYEDS